MIKKYINKLADENDQTLDKLKKQMKDLLNELSSAEEWSESLQRENNTHTNIFSPRNRDNEIGQKIEKAISSVSQIKQQIEYVRDLIETHLQKKAEYEKMFAELENSEKDEENDKNEFLSSENFIIEDEIKKEENEISNTFVNNKQENKQSDLSRHLDHEISDKVLQQFLSELYAKTELCLALLNGNKNRCKKELNSMKQEIKRYSETLKKQNE